MPGVIAMPGMVPRSGCKPAGAPRQITSIIKRPEVVARAGRIQGALQPEMRVDGTALATGLRPLRVAFAASVQGGRSRPGHPRGGRRESRTA